MSRSILPAWFIGEVLGTFLLVFFGCGSIATAVTTGAFAGVLQIALVWGLGVMIAIYLTVGLSGSHLNPAVTLTLAVFRGFPAHRIIPYVIAQLLGGFLASAVLFLIFSDEIAAYEKANHLVRGEPGSEATAMIFGEYFPNPAGKPLNGEAAKALPARRAFLTEVIGTALLLLVILSVTDEKNCSFPPLLTAPVIGLTITLLISLFGPLTMACLNPARDLPPRIFSALAGWGTVPFTANGTGWWMVYLLAPLLGGWVGGALYFWILKPAYERTVKPVP